MQNLAPASSNFINAFAQANCGTWNGNSIHMSPQEAYDMIATNSANGLKTTIENGYFKVLNLSNLHTKKWLYQLPGMEHLQNVEVLDVRKVVIWQFYFYPESTIKKIIVDAMPKAYSGTRFINIIHNDHLEEIEGFKSYGGNRKLILFCTKEQKKRLKFSRKRNVYCYPKDPIERHDFVDQEACNWDGGLDMLLGIINDPTTERATALKIYWTGKPEWYQQYKTYSNIPYGEQEQIFRFLSKIRYKLEEGFYAKGNLSFDPADWVNMYPEITKVDTDFTRIPEAFYQKIG